MPTLVAMLVASLAGWLMEEPVRALLGFFPSTIVVLLASTAVFVFARRFLSDLRGGS